MQTGTVYKDARGRAMPGPPLKQEYIIIRRELKKGAAANTGGG
jgi:hypothetical protein